MKIQFPNYLILVNLNMSRRHKATLLNYNKTNSYKLDNFSWIDNKGLGKALLDNQLLAIYTLSKLHGDHRR